MVLILIPVVSQGVAFDGDFLCVDFVIEIILGDMFLDSSKEFSDGSLVWQSTPEDFVIVLVEAEDELVDLKLYVRLV